MGARTLGSLPRRLSITATTLTTNGISYLISPKQDIPALKLALVRAGQAGGRFVDILTGDQTVSVLVNEHSGSSMVVLPKQRTLLATHLAVPFVLPQRASEQEWLDDYEG